LHDVDISYPWLGKQRSCRVVSRIWITYSGKSTNRLEIIGCAVWMSLLKMMTRFDWQSRWNQSLPEELPLAERVVGQINGMSRAILSWRRTMRSP
jgi:hypothetical protein